MKDFQHKKITDNIRQLVQIAEKNGDDLFVRYRADRKDHWFKVVGKVGLLGKIFSFIFD